jgi:hypothetical protein
VSHLLSEILLGPLRLENRIVIAPMCRFSATNGQAYDWRLMHLGKAPWQYRDCAPATTRGLFAFAAEPTTTERTAG